MTAVEHMPYYLPETYPEEPQVHVTEDRYDPYWVAAEHIEAQVFMESGYVETPEELAHEYKPYLRNTRMIALEDQGEVVGNVRMIDFKIGQGLKTLNDASANRLHISQEGWSLLESKDPRTFTEVGTIALREDYRRSLGKAVNYLYGQIHTTALEIGRPNVIASFDARYFRGFSRYFGHAVTALGEPRDYMGSPTVTALIDAEKLHYDHENNSFAVLP